MINWRIIGVAFLFAIGVYMRYAYRETVGLSTEQQQEYQRKRYIGLALIVLSVGLCIFLYYTGRISFKASMPGDCEDCNTYIKRHGELRPYAGSEIKTLTAHADACRQCSNMCVDRLSLAKKATQRGIETGENVDRIRRDCARSTKFAILAKNELERLKKGVREKYGKFWRQYPEAPPVHFPEVPE